MDPLIAYDLKNGDGYTWTIASRISDALHKVESLYGERDRSYFLAGFEFWGTHPRIWYPGNRKHIIIQLSLSAKEDFPRAIYQLAHEVTHLLSPFGKQQANVLEEGMAEHFAQTYSLEVTGIPWNATGTAYTTARDLVRRLLALDSTAIKQLRAHEPQICRITADLMKSKIPGIPDDLADRLCEAFVDCL